MKGMLSNGIKPKVLSLETYSGSSSEEDVPGSILHKDGFIKNVKTISDEPRIRTIEMMNDDRKLFKLLYYECFDLSISLRMYQTFMKLS